MAILPLSFLNAILSLVKPATQISFKLGPLPLIQNAHKSSQKRLSPLRHRYQPSRKPPTSSKIPKLPSTSHPPIFHPHLNKKHPINKPRKTSPYLNDLLQVPHVNSLRLHDLQHYPVHVSEVGVAVTRSQRGRSGQADAMALDAAVTGTCRWERKRKSGLASQI